MLLKVKKVNNIIIAPWNYFKLVLVSANVNEIFSAIISIVKMLMVMKKGIMLMMKLMMMVMLMTNDGTCSRPFRDLPREIPNAGQDLTRPDNCGQT